MNPLNFWKETWRRVGPNPDAPAKNKAERAIRDEYDLLQFKQDAGRNPLISRRGTVLIPFSMLLPPLDFRSGLDTLTAHAGAEFDITYPGMPFLPRVAAPLVAGATIRSVDGISVRFPTITPAAVVEFTENPGSDLSKADPVTGGVAMRARSLGTNFDISNQERIAAASGVIGVIELLRSFLATTFLPPVELMLWNEIAGNSTIPTVAIGTDGGAVTEAVLADCVKTVKLADTPPGNLKYFLPPAEEARWRVKARTNASAGNLIAPGGLVIGDYPFATSTRIPANLTKGTATTICSGLVFGDVADLLITDHGGGVELLVNPYTKATQGLTSIHGYAHVDVGTIRGGSLVKVLDAR